MGNMTLAREDARALWGYPWFESICQDVRHGVRSLRRSPGLVVVSGEIDAATAHLVHSALDDFDTDERIVVDMAAVEFMYVSGIMSAVNPRRSRASQQASTCEISAISAIEHPAFLQKAETRTICQDWMVGDAGIEPATPL